MVIRNWKKIDILKFGLWHFIVCSAYANFDKNETIKNVKLVKKSFGPIQGVFKAKYTEIFGR
jgi:hypothetical protein